MQRQIFWLMVTLVAALACPGKAAVDLVTLPTREGTHLTGVGQVVHGVSSI